MPFSAVNDFIKDARMKSYSLAALTILILHSVSFSQEKKISGSVSLRFAYFHGQYQNWEGDTANHFALVPLLIEGRY
jgi:hypothetical protein